MTPDDYECRSCHCSMYVPGGMDPLDEDVRYCDSCAADEIERLRAIVARMAKTADGVPIVLGQTELWARDDYDDPPKVFRLGTAFALTVGVAMGPPKVMAGQSRFVDCDQTYSTREAAEKARTL